MTTPDDSSGTPSSGTPHEALPSDTSAVAQGGDVGAKTAPLTAPAPLRFDLLKEMVVVPADFDTPLPNDVLASFDGS